MACGFVGQRKRTKLRAYYEQDGITIYNADCREVLPSLPGSSIGMVFTSPPYNLGEGMEDKGGLRVGHKGSKWTRSDLRNGYGSLRDDLPYDEYIAFQQKVLGECWRVLDDAGAIYYNHKPRIVKGVCRLPLALTAELPLRQIIIWYRRSGFNFSNSFYVPQHEWIVVLAKPDFYLRDRSASGVGDVWDISPDTDMPDHPAAFPIALPSRAIKTTKANVVLDPFMGSGTTLRAAKDLGREAVGIEICEKYCEIAAKRLRQSVLPIESFRPGR